MFSNYKHVFTCLLVCFAVVAESAVSVVLGTTPATIFLTAVKKGDIAGVLNANIEDINTRDEKYGRTALMYACYPGHTEIVQHLINAKADVNLEANDGTTALTYAISNGHTSIVKMLLLANADVNMVTKEGTTGKVKR